MYNFVSPRPPPHNNDFIFYHEPYHYNNNIILCYRDRARITHEKHVFRIMTRRGGLINNIAVFDFYDHT